MQWYTLERIVDKNSLVGGDTKQKWKGRSERGEGGESWKGTWEEEI